MHNEQERLENGLFGDCEEKSGREGGEGERDRERERRAGRERSNVRGRRRGWACQLVDILNGKLPRPSLQPATTLEQTKGSRGKGGRGVRDRQR